MLPRSLPLIWPGTGKGLVLRVRELVKYCSTSGGDSKPNMSEQSITPVISSVNRVESTYSCLQESRPRTVPISSNNHTSLLNPTNQLIPSSMGLAVRGPPESRRDNDYSAQPCAMRREWRVRVLKRGFGRIQEDCAIEVGYLAIR